MQPNDDPRDMAALWIARTRDPAFSDWAGLTDWLEADPANNIAYEAAHRAHDAAGLVADPVAAGHPIAANDEVAAGEGIFARAGRWIVGAAVASALAIGAISWTSGPAEYLIATEPGQQRSVDLEDGSRIYLNGATRLMLDRKASRSARLVEGEANFNIVHDASRPFTVEVGGRKLQDLGTRFNVIRTSGATEVAVAEGAVLFDPGGASVKLTPGRVLRTSDRTNMLDIADTAPDTIGAWQTGSLSYRDATLEKVAEDLARTIGQSIDVAPDIAQRRFSGVIVVKGVDRATFFSQLPALLDVAAAEDATGWHLSARPRAPR